MPRFPVLVLFVAVSFAQTAGDLFNKPPADVDQALRARITEFYTLHVKGDFRKAEALVAEETKDLFYNAEKTKYLSFEISRIEYSSNFTRAKATVLLEQIIRMPMFPDTPFKVPTPSRWKLVDGKWYWYMDLEALRETPFGKMSPGPDRAPGTLPAPGAVPTTTPDWILNEVKLDKQSVSLRAGESEEVAVTNGAPGPMSISVAGKVPGIDVKFDRTDLKAGEKALLTLRAGNDARSGVLSIRVEQTGEMLPIQITVK
jgi:hypothetical protein